MDKLVYTRIQPNLIVRHQLEYHLNFEHIFYDVRVRNGPPTMFDFL